jgi:hypothetical protein
MSLLEALTKGLALTDPASTNMDVHARITAILGVEIADKFCSAFGGREIYIPTEPRSTNRIVMTMGLETAKAICAELGRGAIIVPLNRYTSHRKRRAIAMVMLRSGKSNNAVAEALGCHTRTVTRITRELRQQGRLK